MRAPPPTDVTHLRPWLGRDAFAEPTPRSAQRLVAETGEERLWRRWFPRMFAPDRRPGPVVRGLHHVVVTPIAHLTFLNLDYQIYLNQILHTSAGAWLGHLVCIPINVALLFYALAVHTGAAAPVFGLNAGLVLLVLLATWYTAMAVRMRAGLWAVFSLAVLLGLWALGNLGAGWALAAGRPWFVEPLALIVAVSSLQAYSHLFERNVPPRANFEDHWLPVREFIWGDARELSLGRRLVRLAWTPIGGLWGALDEWWASAKLLPMYLLELLWMCGYQRGCRDHYRRVSRAVLASGDPALDFVGIGGGASVVALGEADEPELDAPFPEAEPSWAT